MPRIPRAAAGGICYHVLNRGNARAVVYQDDPDYRSFLALLRRANARLPTRILAYCLMPNHFHLVLWPYEDGDMSRWMQWLLTAHVRRHHRRYGSDGRIWQGRYKAFPIQQDTHLLAVMRYVERNPLRANLVPRAEEWPWSSLTLRLRGRPSSVLSMSPTPLPEGWLQWVNLPQTEAEIQALRWHVRRGAPLGDAGWARDTAGRLGLDSTLRPQGRPAHGKSGSRPGRILPGFLTAPRLFRENTR